MSFEGGRRNDLENIKKKLDEKKLKENQKKILAEQQKKEFLKTEIETDNALMDLKDLIEQGVITKETAKKIVEGEHIDEETISDIFDKIDELEDIKDIDKFIPAELRISKQDYSKALHDDIFRLQTITKLNTSLTILAQQISPDTAVGMNLFSGFLNVLDRNLIKVQEYTIDIKDNLVNIDDKKYPKLKLNIWDEIKVFFRDLIK